MNAKRKLLLVALAGAVVLAGGAFAWKNGKGSGNAAAVATAAKPGERPIELIAAELHTIKPRGLVDVVRFTGTTQPVDQTIVKARVAGRLAEVLVREGDRVAKGQVLARFETNELQSQGQRAAIGARRRPRRRALDGARPRRQGDAGQAQHRLAVGRSMPPAPTAENKASMVSVAEAQLEIAQRNLRDAEVKAPFDGVVGERIANQGESLPIDGKILALLDTSHVEVAAQMPAADVVRLKVGQPATRDAGRLRRARVPGPHHPHQPDGAGRLALDPGLCRDQRPPRRAARRPVRHGLGRSSPRRAMRSPCRPPPCARTTQGDYVLADRERRAGAASRSAPCAPGRAASSSR